MIDQLVPDDVWERIAPLLPPRRPRQYRHPGLVPVDDRAALAGIVFVLTTGIPWNELPSALFGCSGLTCNRRFRNWTEAGVWPKLYEHLVDQLRPVGQFGPGLHVAPCD